MQLWYASTSPFARKVRVAAEELGLTSRLDLIEVDPWTNTRLRALNPLAKVPTLVLDQGECLYESAVICDYFDALGPERRLIPPAGPGRWRALRLQGLADGASAAAGRLFADEHRPRNERSDGVMERQRLALAAALAAVEAERLDPEICTVGEISVGVLLGYLDFRWPDREWRRARPALSEWFSGFSARYSMVSTEHRPARPL